MSLSAERLLPTYPALLRLSWPMVVSRSTQVVIGLTDAAMVAHLGQDALAATTSGAMNSYTFFILPLGTVGIVASFASQSLGRGESVGSRRFAYYGLVVALAAQLVVAAALPFLGTLLAPLGFSDTVRPLLEGYLRIRMLGIWAMVGVEALTSYYSGIGNTRLPMLVNVLAMGFNIFGNWLLIDGHWGLPALGVAGSAWASALASMVAFVGLFAWFLVESVKERAGWPRLTLSELGRTPRFGLPSGLNYFAEFLAFLFFIDVVMAGLGTTVLAAIMTVFQLNAFAFMPAFAFAGAGSILVGQAIGADKLEDVGVALRKTLVVAGGWQVLIAVAYLSAPKVILGPFVSGDSPPELLWLGVKMLAISTGWQLFDAAASVLAECLRAAGDTAFTLYTRLALAWGMFVPGAFVTVRYLGYGESMALVWLVLYLAALALVLALRYRTGAWRRFKLLEPAS